MHGQPMPLFWFVAIPLTTIFLGIVGMVLYFKRSGVPQEKQDIPTRRESALLETARVVGAVLGFVAVTVAAVYFLLPYYWKLLTSNGLGPNDKIPDANGKLVNVYHQPLWTYLATATVPLLGGMVALYQYNRGHQQKEEQFAREQEKKEEQFAQEQRAKRFSDIQVRFGSADRDTRAVAAHQLAEIAQEKSGQGYPFFIPVVKQLATRLHMKQDSAVRKTVSEGLIDLAKFAVKLDNAELVLDLIHRLAEANRTAQETLAGAIGEFSGMYTDEYWAFHNSSEDDSLPGWFDLLDPLTRLHKDQQIALKVLDVLSQRSEFYAGSALYSSLRKAQPDSERTKEDNQRRSRLQGASVCLLDTIRVLSECLIISRSVKLVGLKLNFLLLVGANLTRAQLTGADLTGAQLTGANLTYANVTGADLFMANLRKADLTGANLHEAVRVSSSVVMANFGNIDYMSVDELSQLLALMEQYPRHDWPEKYLALLPANSIDANNISAPIQPIHSTPPETPPIPAPIRVESPAEMTEKTEDDLPILER